MKVRETHWATDLTNLSWKDGRAKPKSDGNESNIALRYKEQEMVETHSHLHPEGIRYIKEDRLPLSETIGWK